MPVIDAKRTQLDSEHTINLSKVAESLRESGYDVKTLRGGTLSVTSPDLSNKNEIRITRKNAYIERADYEAPRIESVYNKMRDDVVKAMKDDFAREESLSNILKNSPSLNGISAQSVLREMITEFSKEKDPKDYGDLFKNPKLEYSFKDDKNRDFLSIKAEYQLNARDQVEPVISVRYGEDYGNYKETFPVSKEDIEALGKGELCTTDLAKKLDDICRIGTHDRTETVNNLSYKDKLPEFTPAASLEDLNKANEAKMEDLLKQKASLTMSAVSLDKIEIRKDGKLMEDDFLPDEPNWIKGIVSLCHKLEDFRNGPVQDLLDSAEEMRKGIFYKDNLMSGVNFEVSDIGENFREGFGYGKMVYQMERQANELLKSEDKELRLQGIDRKVDAQVLRHGFEEHYNAYSKAAFKVSELTNKTLETLQSVKREALLTGRAMTKVPLANLKEKFQEYMAEISVRIREAKMWLSVIGKDLKEFGIDKIGMASRAQASLVDNLKNGYNAAVDLANSELSSRKYTQQVIAERINDDALVQQYENCSYKEFMKTTAPRFWNEIDSTISYGKYLQQIPEADRTMEDTAAIRLGRQAEDQKIQTWAIAGELQKHIPEFMKSQTVTRKEAIENLAQTYYDTKNIGEYSGSTWSSITEKDKESYRELMNSLLKVMPNVEQHLEKNERALAPVKETKDR